MFKEKLGSTLGILVAGTVLIAAIISFEYHFAKAKDVAEFKIETVKTLEQLRKEWSDESSRQRTQSEYDYALRRMYDLRLMLKQNPGDESIRKDYEEALDRVKQLARKLGK